MRRFRSREPRSNRPRVNDPSCWREGASNHTGTDQVKAKRALDRPRGQVTARGENRYLVRVYLGRDAGGKRKYSARMVQGTYKTASRELTRMLRELDTGSFIEPSKQSLQDYLKAWLENSVRLTVAERTFEDYKGRLLKDVIPALGAKRLESLSLNDFQQVYARMVTRGLSPRTVRYTHAIVKQALEKAVVSGLLFRNPAQHADLPRQQRNEMAVLTPVQVNSFLAVTKESELHALWVILLLGGLRPGEALGLKWGDIDGQRVRIVRSLKKGKGDTVFLGDPKTDRSRRTVLLSAHAMDALHEHRVRQSRRMLQTGPKYRRDDLVFTNAVGGPMDLSKVRRQFKQALSQCGLPSIRLYDSRHTHATLMLTAGVNPKVVSERLGHTNIGITLDTYSHVLPDMLTLPLFEYA